jgi:hypothetical protein
MSRRHRNNEHEWTTYRELEDGTEVELTVTYTITPYDPGISYGPPERCYPPEGGDVEIVAVTDDAGNVIEPTEAELKAWDTAIYEQHDFDAGWYDD